MKLVKNNQKKEEMKRKPKVAHEGAQSNQENTDTKKFAKFLKWFNLKNDIVVAILVIIGSIVWFYLFKNLIQYLSPWLYLVVLFIATYVVSTFFSKAVKDGEEKKRKLVKWLPILLVFIFHFLPSLDKANYNPEGNTLNWINIENGRTYHRFANEIHKDAKGEYFFDPKTGDTCRRATNYWRLLYKKKNHTARRVYTTEYDTLVDKVYSVNDAKKGYIYTQVYGYDVNSLSNPVIVVINLQGKDDSSVVIAYVDGDKKIYASYRNPVAKYRYTKKICKNIDLSVPIAIKGDSRARVLLLDEKRVRQSLAQK